MLSVGSSHLHLELSGVEALERQMTSDLNAMKQRKAYAEYSRTLPGILLNCANWSLSVYCIYRLFMVRQPFCFVPYRNEIAAPNEEATRPFESILTMWGVFFAGMCQLDIRICASHRGRFHGKLA